MSEHLKSFENLTLNLVRRIGPPCKVMSARLRAIKSILIARTISLSFLIKPDRSLFFVKGNISNLTVILFVMAVAIWYPNNRVIQKFLEFQTNLQNDDPLLDQIQHF